MDHTTLPAHADPAHAFVLEVLRTGLMLTDLVAGLIESTPEGAFAGEETGDVLVAMLAGTVRPAVVAAGPDVVDACTALLGALGDRTLRDMEEAARRAKAATRPGRRGRRP
jgi:hypothetical protein